MNKDTPNERLEDNNTIFDITRSDWSYKGVLHAVMEIEPLFFDGIDKKLIVSLPDLNPALLAIIYIDENGDWILKGRLKFASEAKQVFISNHGKSSSEEEILKALYERLPLTNKEYISNVKGDLEGMIEIITDPSKMEYKKVFDDKGNLIESKYYD